MESLQIFNYEGNDISFKHANGMVYVNASEMAKPFGKRTSDYLSNQSTKDFIASYIKRNPKTGNPVLVIHGGTDAGTWMLEDIALDFAQWLSADFRFWCNTHIKNLLTVGMTALPETLDAMINNPDLVIGLATKLKAETAAKEDALKLLDIEAHKNESLQQHLTVIKPKAEYFDEVLVPSATLTTNKIAADLGITGRKLNSLLVEWKIQYKESGTYMLYAKYRGQNLADYNTYPKKGAGEGETVQHMVWTQIGRKFITELYQSKTIHSCQTNTVV